MLSFIVKPEQKKVLSVNFAKQDIHVTPCKTFFPIISVDVKFIKILIDYSRKDE